MTVSKAHPRVEGLKAGGDAPTSDGAAPRRPWLSSDVRRGSDATLLIALQHLLMEFESLPAEEAATPERQRERRRAECLLAELRDGRWPKNPWLELFELEARNLRLQPEPLLRRRIWRLRQEYQRLATADLYDAYVKSNPPDPQKAVSAEVVADAAFLSDELQRLRVGRNLMEIVRTYLTVTAVVFTFLALGGAVRRYNVSPSPPFNVLIWLPVVAVFGSFFSLMSRLYRIPVKGDLIERFPSRWRVFTWLLSPYLSAAQGMVAALALYFFFRAGVGGQVSIFPNLAAADGLITLQTLAASEVAKLLLWGFVAGFSERLVPDMLSQLAEKANARQAVARS